MTRWQRFLTFWGRKGMGFLVCSAAIVAVGLWSPQVAEACAMWLVGAYGVLAGADAAVTVGTAGKTKQPKKNPPPLQGQPVEQPPPEGNE